MMEENRTTISDLIHRSRPLAAALSLLPSSTLHLHKGSSNNHSQKPPLPISQNPNLKTLKPLNHPTLLIGVVTLPSFANRGSPIKCSCFHFSDGSACICCEILDFDPKMIDQKIRILAWNFLPLKCGNMGVKGGFLEIIAWDLFHTCSGNVCSLFDYSCFCLSLGVCNVKDNSKASCSIFGVIESISPVCVVPCASGGRGLRNINGFLVNILVCQCKCCASKYLVSELRELCEKNVKDHCFIESVIVYFCGLASSWHPVISKVIGDVALLSGLQKKLVFIRPEESQLMYVTTDGVSLHTKLFTERALNHSTDIRGKGECGSYTGVITGSYMQGMVLELDQDVMLLLTDEHLIVPHCVRVGALVTLKNVHFVDPKFRWGKMLILGSCCRTSLHVESFSPLESWCHLKSHSPSILQKFIDSLSSAARLWTLLVVSCFRKKFAGVLSDKEILGSKHKEGLAQKYASSHLPLSAFQFRHGVFLEFCRHDLCSGGKDVDSSDLRLVLPVANLVSYCEASWQKVLDEQEKYFDLTGGVIQKNPLWCSGRPYVQSIKRVLHSEEIGLLVLGTLKISLSSGRLQLVDATGNVDIALDHLATSGFDRIFEAKDCRIIIEGIPPKLVVLDSTIYQPLSCRSILNDALPLKKLKTSVYLYHCPSDKNYGSHFFDWKKNAQDFDCGKYQLLVLTHKFPIQRKFLGNPAKRSSMFAEAIVLPWYLLVTGKYREAVTTMVSSDHCNDSLKNLVQPKKYLSHKRCKGEQDSAKVSSYSLNDARNCVSSCSGFCSSHQSSYPENSSCVSNNQQELPFSIADNSVNLHWMGMLHCVNEPAKIISNCKPPRRKLLLEFGPNCFSKYEALKIGCCYLVKHQDGHICCTKNYQVNCAKILISSETHFSSLTFSSHECLQSTDVVDGFLFHNLHISSDELKPKGYWEFEIPCLIGNSVGSEIYSDINIYLASSALNLLENVIKVLVCIPEEQREFAEDSGIHNHGGMINASMQSSGTSCSDYPLPEGNLITLCGIILSFHDCHGVGLAAQPCHLRAEGSPLMSLQEHAGVCVHVIADNHTVRIFCNSGIETCPIGFGRDVRATFHRILVLSEPNMYMMTPASFITIDHTSLMTGNLTHDLNFASGTVGLHSVASPNTVPTSLISDALQSSELESMQFRCRVVALYILVLEISGTSATSQSCLQVPFAGFIIDDGSATCCCWADSERASALLGLESKEYLHEVLERHGRITVKNYGSMFDSSSQDLTFSVDSETRSLSSSNEDVLGSIISKAFLTTSWDIVGRVMDQKGTRWLEERLNEVDVGVALPSLLNIWATSICSTDALAHARTIIHQLF